MANAEHSIRRQGTSPNVRAEAFQEPSVALRGSSSDPAHVTHIGSRVLYVNWYQAGKQQHRGGSTAGHVHRGQQGALDHSSATLGRRGRRQRGVDPHEASACGARTTDASGMEPHLASIELALGGTSLANALGRLTPGVGQTSTGDGPVPNKQPGHPGLSNSPPVSLFEACPIRSCLKSRGCPQKMEPHFSRSKSVSFNQVVSVRRFKC